MSRSQVYALVRAKTITAVKIGGRGQWRVERVRLEEYITGLYAREEGGVDGVSQEDDGDGGGAATFGH